MSKTTYQVILSTDGKHSIIGTTTDPAELKAVVSWVKGTYDAVVKAYGLKAEQYLKVQANGNGNANADVAAACPTHHTGLRPGKYGLFCSQKNPDGSWCSYRPEDRT